MKKKLECSVHWTVDRFGTTRINKKKKGNVVVANFCKMNKPDDIDDLVAEIEGVSVAGPKAIAKGGGHDNEEKTTKKKRNRNKNKNKEDGGATAAAAVVANGTTEKVDAAVAAAPKTKPAGKGKANKKGTLASTLL